MGSYANVTDVEAELTTLTVARLTTTSGVIPDDAITNEQIDLAEQEINAYLTKRVKVPVVTTDASMKDWLKGLTLAITVYRLYKRKTIDTPLIKDAYNRAREDLKAFVEGEISTPSAIDIDGTLSEEPESEYGFQPLASGRTNMEGL